jgi:hypothetical protein
LGADQRNSGKQTYSCLVTNGRWPVAEADGLTEPVIGAGRQRLDEAWQDGAEAYPGITVTECTNFFLLDSPNTKLGWVRTAAAPAAGLAGA